MDVIKQWIEESDVFLLILGGRYGSVGPNSEKSYVHLEYEYALQKGKPIFACVINESALEQKVKASGRGALEQERPQDLKQFHKCVCTKMVKFWDDAKDIKIAVSEALSVLSRNDELVGWVRADHQADMPALADEIARLSKENSSLRTQLAKQPQDLIVGLPFLEMKTHLEQHGVLTALLNYRETGKLDNDDLIELTKIGVMTVENNRFSLTGEGQKFVNKWQVLNAAGKLPT